MEANRSKQHLLKYAYLVRQSCLKWPEQANASLKYDITPVITGLHFSLITEAGYSVPDDIIIQCQCSCSYRIMKSRDFPFLTTNQPFDIKNCYYNLK